MRSLFLWIAVGTLYSAASSSAPSSIEWVSSTDTVEQPLIHLDSWENSKRWNLCRVPDRQSTVYISPHSSQHHQMIAFPTKGKAVYKILDIAAPYHSLQTVSLLANGTHIKGHQTFIGTIGNKGKVLLKMKNQAVIQSLHPRSCLVLAEEGVGVLELRAGSRLEQHRMIMGKAADTRAELAVSGSASSLKLEQLEMGIKGRSTLYMDHQATAEIDYIKMALENEGSNPSKAYLRLRHDGTVLRVPHRLELAQKGRANIQVAHGAHLIAQDIQDMAPRTPRASNDIEIIHHGQLTVADTLTLGSGIDFMMRVLKGGHVNVNYLDLQANKKTRLQNNLLISDQSSMNIHRLWTMNAQQGKLSTIISKESTVFAKKLIMGQFGTGVPILQIHESAQYLGDSAIIGLNEPAIMMLKNNAIVELKNDLTIAKNEGSTGLLYIHTHAPSSTQIIYGALVEAKKIMLGPEGKAEIHINNHHTDILPTQIVADIDGYGYIRKSGSGILRLVGQQSWEGLFDIQEGTVDIPHGSVLSPLVDHKVDQRARLCLHQKIQSIYSLLNHGTVQFDDRLQGSILLIDDLLLGQGKFLMHANFVQRWTDQIEIANTLSGEQELEFVIHQPTVDFGRLLVAVAHHVEPSDRLFYLGTKYADAIGVYRDVGLYRMNIELVRETGADQVTYWFLQSTPRKPALEGERKGQYAHLSLPAQEAIETLKKNRPKDHLIHQGVFHPTPPIAAYQENQLSAVTSPTQLTGYLSPLPTWDHHQMVGVSYALQTPHARYTFETFTTKNKGSSAHLASHEQAVTTQSARVKWQHISGWQSYMGIEQGKYAPTNAWTAPHSSIALPPGQSLQTHFTSFGIAYFEHLPSHWSAGPLVQYHHLRTSPLTFQWDHQQSPTLEAQSTHSFETQFGLQLQYHPPAESLYPLSLRVETVFKRHRENIQLKTESESATIPYRTTGYDVYAQLEGELSQHARWHISLENQYLTGEPRRWGARAQWFYLY